MTVGVVDPAEEVPTSTGSRPRVPDRPCCPAVGSKSASRCTYGRLALAARKARRDVRRGTADLLIAATADAYRLTLLTRDERLARLPDLRAELV